MNYIIGLDVGSQSVKACVFNGDGQRLAVTSAPCLTSHPASGWAEQDPVQWHAALTASVRAACAESGISRTDEVTLGLACQVDGVVAASAAHQPLRPAIIWMDRRAGRQTEALSAAVGDERLHELTGLNPDSSHSGPKAMWLRDNEPDVYGSARWLGSVGAYLNGWLTGEVVHDHANASSSLLYDLRTRDWSPELVERAGLDPAQLPAVAPAAAVIGTLRAEIAERFGLSSATRVVTGTGDDHAAAVGAGAVTPGILVDVTGTAEPVAVPAAEIVIDAERLVETHAHAVDGLLLIENPGFVSGGSTQWLARVSGREQGDLFALAGKAPAGSGGVVFVPALSGSMAPRWNDDIRGCFAGLALDHGIEHMTRAVLEGCAYALRDIVDRLDELGTGGDEIRVVGGGARSELWLQIKADVTGRTVRRVLGDCATSAGAAMLAGLAAGVFADLDEAVAQCVELAAETVEPDPAEVERYTARYAAYRSLFDAMEEWTR
jgi:xylulokinase